MNATLDQTILDGSEVEDARSQLPAIRQPMDIRHVPRPSGPADMALVWSLIKEMAVTVAAAGKGGRFLPKGIENKYQVASIMLKGAEVGFTPMYALSQIALVEGKPTISAEGLATIIKRAEGKDAVRWFRSDTEGAKVGLKYRGDTEYMTCEWTIDRAVRAGLCHLDKDGKVEGKDNWKKYQEYMLRWRTLSEAAHMYMPEIIAGFYTPEEMGLDTGIDAEGTEVIEIEPEARTAIAAESWDSAEPPAIDEPVEEMRGRSGVGDPAPPRPQSAYQPRPASANQLATIAKLSSLVDGADDAPETMTSAEASERITVLSREYNERKSSTGSRGGRGPIPGGEIYETGQPEADHPDAAFRAATRAQKDTILRLSEDPAASSLYDLESLSAADASELIADLSRRRGETPGGSR